MATNSVSRSAASVQARCICLRFSRLQAIYTPAALTTNPAHLPPPFLVANVGHAGGRVEQGLTLTRPRWGVLGSWMSPLAATHSGDTPTSRCYPMWRSDAVPSSSRASGLSTARPGLSSSLWA